MIYAQIWQGYLEVLNRNNLGMVIDFLDGIIGITPVFDKEVKAEADHLGCSEQEFRETQSRLFYLEALTKFSKNASEGETLARVEGGFSTLFTYSERVGIDPDHEKQIAAIHGGTNGLKAYDLAKQSAPYTKLSLAFIKAIKNNEPEGIRAYFETMLGPDAPRPSIFSNMTLKDDFTVALTLGIRNKSDGIVTALTPFITALQIDTEKAKVIALHAGGVEGLKMFDRLNGSGPIS